MSPSNGAKSTNMSVSMMEHAFWAFCVQSTEQKTQTWTGYSTKQRMRVHTVNGLALCHSQRMCMRSKARLAARVSLRLARLPPLQGANVTFAPRLRLRQAFSRML